MKCDNPEHGALEAAADECADCLRDRIHDKDCAILVLETDLQAAKLQIVEMQRYIAATEYWKIEPHDQKERAAWMQKLADRGKKVAARRRTEPPTDTAPHVGHRESTT